MPGPGDTRRLPAARRSVSGHNEKRKRKKEKKIAEGRPVGESPVRVRVKGRVQCGGLLEGPLSLSVWHRTCPVRYYTSGLAVLGTLLRRNSPLYGTSAGPAALAAARPLIGFRLRLSRPWGATDCDGCRCRGAGLSELCNWPPWRDTSYRNMCPSLSVSLAILARSPGCFVPCLVPPLCHRPAYRRTPRNEHITCLVLIGGSEQRQHMCI